MLAIAISVALRWLSMLVWVWYLACSSWTFCCSWAILSWYSCSCFLASSCMSAWASSCLRLVSAIWVCIITAAVGSDIIAACCCCWCNWATFCDRAWICCTYGAKLVLASLSTMREANAIAFCASASKGFSLCNSNSSLPLAACDT